jgi:large subunit ribosomal protein L32
MAVPKRRTSRSNTRHRRAQWKATPIDLVPVTIDGETHRVPRSLVRGVQRGYVNPAPRGDR